MADVNRQVQSIAVTANGRDAPVLVHLFPVLARLHRERVQLISDLSSEKFDVCKRWLASNPSNPHAVEDCQNKLKMMVDNYIDAIKNFGYPTVSRSIYDHAIKIRSGRETKSVGMGNLVNLKHGIFQREIDTEEIWKPGSIFPDVPGMEFEGIPLHVLEKMDGRVPDAPRSLFGNGATMEFLFRQKMVDDFLDDRNGWKQEPVGKSMKNNMKKRYSFSTEPLPSEPDFHELFVDAFPVELGKMACKQNISRKTRKKQVKTSGEKRKERPADLIEKLGNKSVALHDTIARRRDHVMALYCAVNFDYQLLKKRFPSDLREKPYDDRETFVTRKKEAIQSIKNDSTREIVSDVFDELYAMMVSKNVDPNKIKVVEKAIKNIEG